VTTPPWESSVPAAPASQASSLTSALTCPTPISPCVVPVTDADDPTSVSVLAAVALSQALDDTDLERYQREALERARADTSTQTGNPGGLRSGTLGGGAIPAQVHAELTTLREELTTSRLAAERLAGLDRLVTILVARGLQPVFVLEDTEAADPAAGPPVRARRAVRDHSASRLGAGGATGRPGSVSSSILLTP